MIMTESRDIKLPIKEGKKMPTKVSYLNQVGSFHDPFFLIIVFTTDNAAATFGKFDNHSELILDSVRCEKLKKSRHFNVRCGIFML